MARAVLVTVGTSLLSNVKRELDLEKPDVRELKGFLTAAEPSRASAETNSLFRLLREGDTLVFLCSDTEEGRLCAEALAGHYRGKRYETSVVAIPDLTYAESRFKMRGLRSLVSTLIGEILRHRGKGREVLINATGGFKAEIAYATLVGLLFDVPVYYIHEKFGEIIEMPPTPIGWDYSLLAEYEEFFAWIEEDLRPTEDVDEYLRSLPQDIRLLLAEEEGCTILSPAGEAFYEAYRERLERSKGVPIRLSTQARKTYEAAEPGVRALFEQALRKLRVRELRFGGAERVHNSDCLVYPRGHRDERIFFYESEEGAGIRVCELARHSDKSYDRLLKKGVWRRDYVNFELWTG